MLPRMVNQKAKLSVFSLLLVGLSVIATGGCGEDDGRHQPVGGQTAPTAAGTTVQIASVVPPVSIAELQPILKERCIRCHSGGPLDWNNSENLLRVAKNGVLLRYMETRHMPLAGSPEAAAITESERDKIISWAKLNGPPGPSVAPKAEVVPPIVANSSIVLGPSSLGSSVKVATGTGSASGAVASGPAALSQLERGVLVAGRCMSCHGNLGISINDDIPNLAGHGPNYIVARLREFMDPTSKSEMRPILAGILRENGFSESLEIVQGKLVLPKDLESLFASVSKTFGLYSVSTSPVDLSKERDRFDKRDKTSYESGRKIARGRCLHCHLNNSLRPMDNAPMIFAQRRSYLRTRLEEFYSPSNRNTMMGMMIIDLVPDDLASLAIYLSTTHPSEANR